ncbi:MAG: alpha/beta hydrolase [Candidatus Aminicenantes bacterium]|nr:MAG: alpha/beta hydrolase [Candidatus Aminicenantes bacterium]
MKHLRFPIIIGLAFLFTFISCQMKPGINQLLVEEGDATSADGIPIHYKLYGEGEVSLVFVHDWCTHMKYWDEQIPSFGVNFKVVTLDLAGHGQSGIGRTTWTMEAFGQDVASIVKKLSLQNVVLIGHGMGGPVILEAAKLIPDKAKGLVGADSFNDLYMKGTSEEQIRLALLPYQENHQEQIREHVRLSWFAPLSDHDLMSEIILDMVKTPKEVVLGSLEELLRYDAAESFKQVQLDVRGVQTTHMDVSYDVTQIHAKSIWVEYLDGLGHFIMMEDPQAFNRHLANYINEFVTGTYSYEK